MYNIFQQFRRTNLPSSVSCHRQWSMRVEKPSLKSSFFSSAAADLFLSSLLQQLYQKYDAWKYSCQKIDKQMNKIKLADTNLTKYLIIHQASYFRNLLFYYDPSLHSLQYRDFILSFQSFPSVVCDVRTYVDCCWLWLYW